jgi:thiol:disulfide interchange protein DsbG
MKSMKRFAFSTAAAVLALSASSGFAQASDASTQNTDNLPKALVKALSAGMKLEKTFPAAGGLTGYIISSARGENMVVFSPENHQVLMAGKLLDDNGTDLSAKYLDQYGPKVDLSKYAPALESAPAIVEGAKGKAVKSTIYAFMDPNCIFCHLTWKALQPYEAAGLQVRWIPVAFQQASSAGKAAALLESKDPQAMLRHGESTYVEEKESLGIDPIPVSAATKAKIDANSKLMADMGFSGTPTVLYKDASGAYVAIQGMPTLSRLPKILNMSEQAVTDPELQRFR